MNEELDQLLEREWAGELDAAGRARLNALSGADPAVAARVREDRQLSTLLARCGPNGAPPGLSRAVFSQMDLPNARPIAEGNWLTRLAPTWAYGLAAASLLTLGAFMITEQGREPTGGRIDRVANVARPAEAERQIAMAPALQDLSKTEQQPADGRLDKANESAVRVGQQASQTEAPAPPEASAPMGVAETVTEPAGAVPGRAEPVPSPTPAPAPTVASPTPEGSPEAAQAEEGQAVASNDPRRLPEKMRPKVTGEAAESAVAVAASPAPGNVNEAVVPEVEMEIQVAALGDASLPAMTGLPLAASSAGPAKMRVTQGFMASEGGAAPLQAPGASDASAEESASVSGKELETLLHGVGATGVQRLPVGNPDEKQVRVTATLNRGQLRSFMQGLKAQGIEPKHTPGSARGFYTIHQGQAALELGTDMKAAQQTVKLSVLVKE